MRFFKSRNASPRRLQFLRVTAGQVVAFQFFKVGAVVFADTKELVGIGDRRQVMHVGVRGQRCFAQLGGIFAGVFEHGASAGEAGFTQCEQAFH